MRISPDMMIRIRQMHPETLIEDLYIQTVEAQILPVLRLRAWALVISYM